MPEWTGGAKWRNMLKNTTIAQCYRQEVGLFSRRYHVDQPTKGSDKQKDRAGAGGAQQAKQQRRFPPGEERPVKAFTPDSLSPRAQKQEREAGRGYRLRSACASSPCCAYSTPCCAYSTPGRDTYGLRGGDFATPPPPGGGEVVLKPHSPGERKAPSTATRSTRMRGR
jgi:hypothetical protein